MDVVRRLEQAEYYVDLLFKMIDEEKCPFYSLIIKKKLVKDIERILNLCEILNEQYVVEKAEGLLLFDALLDQFEKRFHQLEVHETAEALAKQGLFKPLMNEFLSMIAKK